MKLSHKFAVSVMAISLGMIIANAGMEAYERQNIQINCATQVSVENWEIKNHIVTSGEVSEDARVI